MQMQGYLFSTKYFSYSSFSIYRLVTLPCLSKPVPPHTAVEEVISSDTDDNDGEVARRSECKPACARRTCHLEAKDINYQNDRA